MELGNSVWAARWLIVAGATLCLACGTNLHAPVRAKAQGGTGGDEWHLTFHMSGGLAGFDRTLDLGNTGSVTATDRRVGQKLTTATAKELAEITTLLADLKPMERRDAGCRDCIAYTLEVRRSGRSITLRFDDTALRDDKLTDLVDALTTLMDRTLTGRPPA